MDIRIPDGYNFFLGYTGDLMEWLWNSKTTIELTSWFHTFRLSALRKNGWFESHENLGIHQILSPRNQQYNLALVQCGTWILKGKPKLMGEKLIVWFKVYKIANSWFPIFRHTQIYRLGPAMPCPHFVVSLADTIWSCPKWKETWSATEHYHQKKPVDCLGQDHSMPIASRLNQSHSMTQMSTQKCQ